MISNCPVCGYKNSVTASKVGGKVLYYCHAGCDNRDVWAAFEGDNVIPDRVWVAASPKVSPEQYIRKLWKESVPAKGSLVETYLRARGITIDIAPTIRFLPSHKHTPTGGMFPVMLCAVLNAEGKLRAIHRTYLKQDGSGKAEIDQARMTLGSIGGFSVHLSRAVSSLVLAEGIETALSASQLRGLPAWSTLSAGNMEKIILPERIKEVIIAADHDECGLTSASKTARKLKAEGRFVSIIFPDRVGEDWNDYLQTICQ